MSHRYTIHAPSAPPWHHQYEPELFPAAVTLQGSNDGSSWTDLDTQSEVRWPPETPSRSFDVADPEWYTHYRLVIHRSVEPARDRVLIAHLDLFGVTKSEKE